MQTFESLFGIKPAQIKKTCILMPCLTKGILNDFSIKRFIKGKLYSAGSSSRCTLIHTRIGATFLGDAVLYLEKTPCENLILFGSCGLVKKTKDIDIGSIVCPTRAYAYEGFSQVLFKKFDQIPSAFADKTYLDDFLKFNSHQKIFKVVCATFGSLKLEEGNKGFLVKKDIHVIDMECSAFFHAAKSIYRKALAIFYVTDILKEKPLLTHSHPRDQILISQTIKNAAQSISSFLNPLGVTTFSVVTK